MRIFKIPEEGSTYLRFMSMIMLIILYDIELFYLNVEHVFLYREEKQGDLAEQLESVAYVLCGDQPISLQKFYQIFQAKGVSTQYNISNLSKNNNNLIV